MEKKKRVRCIISIMCSIRDTQWWKLSPVSFPCLYHVTVTPHNGVAKEDKKTVKKKAIIKTTNSHEPKKDSEHNDKDESTGKKTKEKDKQRKQYDQSGSVNKKKDEASRVAEGKNMRQTRNNNSTLFEHSKLFDYLTPSTCCFWLIYTH